MSGAKLPTLLDEMISTHTTHCPSNGLYHNGTDTGVILHTTPGTSCIYTLRLPSHGMANQRTIPFRLVRWHPICNMFVFLGMDFSHTRLVP